MNNTDKTNDLTEALETIDDIVDTVGKLIIDIACSNDDFICTACLSIAAGLYRIMRKYAREDDCIRIGEEFNRITGRCIDV